MQRTSLKVPSGRTWRKIGMRKAKALFVGILGVTACGFSTGCDLAFLEDVIKEGLAQGVREEVGQIPGLIIDRVTDALGLPDPDDQD
jgi:hypothetical protein